MNTTYTEHSLKDSEWTTLARRFSVVALWPALLVAAPLLVERFGWAVLSLVVPTGVCLVMWIAVLRHDVWHANYPRLNRRKTFDFLSYLILLDPHPYLLTHGGHHKHVHTTQDPLMF